MKDLETIEANIEQLSLPENYEDKLRSIRWLCAETKRLNAEVKRLQKLEAAVVGSWMESFDRGSRLAKELRYPCVELGYLELRDVEYTRKGFDGNTFTYTSKEFHLKKEYEEMAKQWIKEEYGVEEE